MCEAIREISFISKTARDIDQTLRGVRYSLMQSGCFEDITALLDKEKIRFEELDARFWRLQVALEKNIQHYEEAEEKNCDMFSFVEFFIVPPRPGMFELLKSPDCVDIVIE